MTSINIVHFSLVHHLTVHIPHPRCDSKHHFPLTAIASAEMRDAPQQDKPFLPSAEPSAGLQTLVICVGGSTAVDGENDGGDLLRMMDESSGRVSRTRMMEESSGRVPGKIVTKMGSRTEICLCAVDEDGGLFLANLLEEVQDRIGIERNPEHYLERMLDITSGRSDRPLRFMLHHSSGRRQPSDWEEEGGGVTTDMMRFTSGRQPRPSRFSEEDSP